jgi:hypothetical protein
MFGGVLSLCLERQIDEEKKNNKNMPWPYINQPKAHQRDKGGEGGELRPARGVRKKCKWIVWGQSSWVLYQINIKLMCLLKKIFSTRS